jgi:asparagine synthase (glutamine-hydrolysing)
VPDPDTIYSGIHRLPPGHLLLLHRPAIATLPAPRRYWSPPKTLSRHPAQPAEQLAARLEASVRMRLMSDVPLGSFLSGGVDSSAITAMAARASTSLRTFTIGFPGGADERPAAAAMAARLGTRHQAEAAEIDYVAAARSQSALFGEPFGDHSSVPTMAVCRLARQQVTVALSGDGGDEVFAGYRRYRWHQLAETVRACLPATARRRVLGGLASMYPKLDRAPRWLRAKHTLTEMSLDSALGYYRTVCRLHTEQRQALFSPRLRAELDGHDPAARFVELMGECDEDAPLLQAQYADLHTYLPGDILTKVDRTSMAVSLEVRPPMLDHTLVEWGMALPTSLKLHRGQGKHVLRHAMSPFLPDSILYGPKQGFAAAIGGQFRRQAATIRARLTGSPILDSGLFEPGALAAMVDSHASGHRDHSQALWQLMVLEGFLAHEGQRSDAQDLVEA